MNKVNIGIIGLGIGEQHLIGYKKSKFVDSISICDFNKKKLNSISEKYNIKKIYKTDEEMINDKNLDVISIASYDQFHFNQIVSSLRNNKHVFCEKPICLNIRELKIIEKLLRKKKKLILTTNTILRESPRFLDLKNKIKNGYFGKIYFIELDYNYGRLNKITDGWRGKIDNYSVVFGGGIHMVDLLLWFKGSLPTQIKSFSNNICLQKSKLTINDFVISLLKFKDKSVAKLSCNFGSIYPHFHRIIIYGTKRSYEQTFNSSIFLEKLKNEIRLIKNKEPYPGIEKYGLIDNFLNTIMKKEKLKISTKEMLNVMKLCALIHKSAGKI